MQQSRFWLLLLLPLTLVQAPTRTLNQSAGAAIRAYRTTFGMTQSWLAARTHMSATKLSRIERGLDSSTALQRDSLAVVLDSAFRAQFDPAVEQMLTDALARVRHARLVCRIVPR